MYQFNESKLVTTDQGISSDPKSGCEILQVLSFALFAIKNLWIALKL